MLTYRTTNVETIDHDNVSIGGHAIRCTWDSTGCHVDQSQLRALRDSGVANWSDEEIGDIAYHAELRMNDTYTKAYDIVVYEGYNQDEVHVLESIRAIDDAAANAYATANHEESDWYVLDASGNNING